MGAILSSCMRGEEARVPAFHPSLLRSPSSYISLEQLQEAVRIAVAGEIGPVRMDIAALSSDVQRLKQTVHGLILANARLTHALYLQEDGGSSEPEEVRVNSGATNCSSEDGR